MFGLSDEQLSYIGSTVIEPIHACGGAVFCFGSRARGDHQPFSDLDLLVKGDVSLKPIIAEIAEQLENQNFPYKVDIVFDEDLAEAYRASVTREMRPCRSER